MRLRTRFSITGVWIVLHLVLLSGTSIAQVPLTGRWQNFAFPASAVRADAGLRYAALLADLRDEGTLDTDPVLGERVNRIAAIIIAKAIELSPASGNWPWEVHVTSNAGYEGVSMAGGRLLFGSRYIFALKLTDGEVATLIGHEVAHALAEHQRELVSEALRFSPGRRPVPLNVVAEQLETSLSVQIRLGVLTRIQETEADQLGMILAHRAGWPAESMVAFYQKLARDEGSSVYDWSHPSAASRLSMAKALDRVWQSAQCRLRAAEHR